MVDVTLAQPRHVEAIADLCVEMNRFYGEMRDAPIERLRTPITEALFDPPAGRGPAGRALLAFTDDDEADLVGFASFSHHWPAAGLTRSLWLKELYVRSRARRTGVGRALMEELYAVADREGCTRVELTTERDNAGAQAFYASLGIPVMAEKLYYRLER